MRIATVRGLGYCLEKIAATLPRTAPALRRRRRCRRCEPFQREQRSLFGEILDWMLAPLLLLWPMSMALTWLVAQSIANQPFDRALGRQRARRWRSRSRCRQRRGRRVFSLPAAGARDPARRRHRPRLLPGARPARRARSAATATCRCRRRGRAPRAGEVRFRDDDDARPSRCASPTLGSPRAGRGGAQPPLVQVAETLDKRSQLATEIIKGVILPQFVILPLAVLLVWLALARGIEPLDELQQRIRAREPTT